jgi:hypothetical protein
MPDIKVWKTVVGTYILSGVCSDCKSPQAMTVLAEELFNWQHGVLIQNAFPNLTIDQREFLLSGLCGKCFDKIFANADD